MKKILVPVDFSEEASKALNFAIEFNEKVKGEITLIHVIDMPVPQVSFSGETGLNSLENFYTGEFLKATEERLEEWSQRVVEAGQKVQTKLQYGNAFTQISETLAAVDANWVVMGSKGASGLARIFLGSNAERMIRFAKCPVIIIKDETHLKDIKSMAFATDLSEDQDIIAQHVKDFQEMFKLNLHVVKVKTPYNWLDEKTVQGELKLFAERNFLHDYTLSSIEADFVDHGAVEFAEENHVGLIALGTHGKKGLAHFIGGSVAEDVVNESKIPILVFKIWD